MSSDSPTPRIVRVNLEAGRGYDVVIGRDLMGRVPDLFKALGLSGQVAILADEVMYESHDRQLEKALRADKFEVVSFIMASGELSKSMGNVSELLSRLAQEKFSRSATVIALGGGVIGDLTGFVAATYLRGIALVQVPTTLLAMVDSSVGGKTGVNLPEGKNLVGAFHQPKLVVADLNALETLPAREFSAGMAEVIKYGCIADSALFNRVAGGVKPTDADLADVVARCVEIKARIVERDEFETKGDRALLNFGHTIGHAIEQAGNYTRYLHGEAIALGMRAAAWLSVWQQGLPEAEAQRIEAALTAHGLPLHLDPAIDAHSIVLALGHDKKVAADGRNRWVLLDQMGHAKSGVLIPDDFVRRAIKTLHPERAA